jgi:hypothetical protein
VVECPLDEMNRCGPGSTSRWLAAADPANAGSATCRPYTRKSSTSKPPPEKPDSTAVELDHNIVAFALEAAPQTAPISVVTRRHKSGSLNFASHSPEG